MNKWIDCYCHHHTTSINIGIVVILITVCPLKYPYRNTGQRAEVSMGSKFNILIQLSSCKTVVNTSKAPPGSRNTTAGNQILGTKCCSNTPSVLVWQILQMQYPTKNSLHCVDRRIEASDKPRLPEQQQNRGSNNKTTPKTNQQLVTS